MLAGCKKVQTFINQTEGYFVSQDSYSEQPAISMEVTNSNASEVLITVNVRNDGGVANSPIPVAPGATRIIPMQVYNWQSTGEVS